MTIPRTDHRISVDRLIPLIDVKRALAVSWPYLMDLIHNGELEVYDISGRNLNRAQVAEDSRGLRVLESDLRTYIDSIKVR